MAGIKATLTPAPCACVWCAAIIAITPSTTATLRGPLTKPTCCIYPPFRRRGTASRRPRRLAAFRMRRRSAHQRDDPRQTGADRVQADVVDARPEDTAVLVRPIPLELILAHFLNAAGQRLHAPPVDRVAREIHRTA